MESVSNYLASCIDGVKPFCLWPEYFGSSLETTEKEVDIHRYMGLWHEMARMPQRFQKNCVKTTAEYTFNEEDDTINVLNTCITKTGETKKGNAFAYSCSDNNSKLRVKFVKYISGCYWILDLADDYSWAIVGGPCMDSAWILSRSDEMDQESLQKRVDLLKQKGYDTSKLIYRGEADE